ISTRLSTPWLNTGSEIATNRLEVVPVTHTSCCGISDHRICIVTGSLEGDGLQRVLDILDALLHGDSVQEELLASLFEFPALSLDDLFHLVELLKLDLEFLESDVDSGGDETGHLAFFVRGQGSGAGCGGCEGNVGEGCLGCWFGLCA